MFQLVLFLVVLSGTIWENPYLEEISLVYKRALQETPAFIEVYFIDQTLIINKLKPKANINTS